MPTGSSTSNYQFAANNAQYGRWILSVHRARHRVVAGDFFNCPNQYWNGGPLPAKIAELLGEWTGVELNRFGVWSDDADPALNTSGINLRYANMLGDVQPTARYVIDTSRNGRGPWAPPAYPDPQDWCNPESRSGAGTHARHRSAAAGRVPVGEDTRRVRRRVHPRSRSGR